VCVALSLGNEGLRHFESMWESWHRSRQSGLRTVGCFLHAVAVDTDSVVHGGSGV
jgi:hypothetical protein